MITADSGKKVGEEGLVLVDWSNLDVFSLARAEICPTPIWSPRRMEWLRGLECPPAESMRFLA